MLCLPIDLDACPDGDAGHYCTAPVNHRGAHHCEHGHSWPRSADVELEKAMAAYIAHYTIYGRNGQPNQRPPLRAVLAACLPPDSHWRAVIRAIEDVAA